MSDDEFSDSEFDNTGPSGRRAADENDFDYGDSMDGAEAPRVQSRLVQNQPYDEAVDLSSDGSLDDSVDTAVAGTPARAPQPRGDSPPNRAEESAGDAEYASDVEIPGGGVQGHVRRQAPAPAPAPMPVPTPAAAMPAMPAGAAAARDRAEVMGSMTGGDAGDDDSDSSTEGESVGGPVGKAGGYNPADYAHLNVPDDVRELFQYIGRYKPHNIALDTKIKCFIPDYIPAVGEIDAFIKVDRPDGKEEKLGLKQLDEPAPHQSDPTVLDLQLRAVSKKSNLEPTMVRCIEHAEKNPKEVTKWIQSIQDLHRSNPLPQVHYTKAMPDIERLMQVWPEQFEEMLKTATLPSADMDMSLEEYTRVVCSILDIPVYPGNIVQSLHVLFTLYSEFKTNQHFTGVAGDGGAAAGAGGGGAQAGAGGPGDANIMTFGGEEESKAMG